MLQAGVKDSDSVEDTRCGTRPKCTDEGVHETGGGRRERGEKQGSTERGRKGTDVEGKSKGQDVQSQCRTRAYAKPRASADRHALRHDLTPEHLSICRPRRYQRVSRSYTAGRGEWGEGRGECVVGFGSQPYFASEAQGLAGDVGQSVHLSRSDQLGIARSWAAWRAASRGALVSEVESRRRHSESSSAGRGFRRGGRKTKDKGQRTKAKGRIGRACFRDVCRAHPGSQSKAARKSARVAREGRQTRRDQGGVELAELQGDHWRLEIRRSVLGMQRESGWCVLIGVGCRGKVTAVNANQEEVPKIWKSLTPHASATALDYVSIIEKALARGKAATPASKTSAEGTCIV
ncbi:hypothetical protein B0H14DRAFT_2563074 [Mycena olivaceomarginata]|nr:hypothetical protein B0H14DRAFT_2563074 [Mycena olivaceomarginata]